MRAAILVPYISIITDETPSASSTYRNGEVAVEEALASLI